MGLFLNGLFFLHPFFFNQTQISPHNILPDPSTVHTPNLSAFACKLRLGDQLPPGVTRPSRRPIPTNSIKHYKRLLHLPSNVNSRLTARQWNQFWRLQIPIQTRTTWFRSIHQKIPHRSALRRMMQNTYPSPFCQICDSRHLNSEETLDHFLFLCPSKLSIWSSVYSTYVSTSPTLVISSFLQKQLQLSLPEDFERDSSITLYPTLSISQIFACTLQSIWAAHWRFIFNQIPFFPSNILASVSTLLYRLTSELQLDTT
jgi:hypothetical protein